MIPALLLVIQNHEMYIDIMINDPSSTFSDIKSRYIDIVINDPS